MRSASTESAPLFAQTVVERSRELCDQTALRIEYDKQTFQRLLNRTTGNRSLHADGHALDFGAPGWPSQEAKKKLLDFAEYASKTWGAQLEELIHTPLGGRQINDGHYFVYTGITADQH